MSAVSNSNSDYLFQRGLTCTAATLAVSGVVITLFDEKLRRESLLLAAGLAVDRLLSNMLPPSTPREHIAVACFTGALLVREWQIANKGM